MAASRAFQPTAVTPARAHARSTREGNLVLPGFIDLHIHGGRGFDVMDGTVEAVQGLARHLPHTA